MSIEALKTEFKQSHRSWQAVVDNDLQPVLNDTEAKMMARGDMYRSVCWNSDDLNLHRHAIAKLTNLKATEQYQIAENKFLESIGAKNNNG